jgi:hypothetical protein
LWETEDASMLAEAVENETKRMRFTAAVSLDEPIDYAPLDGLTVDMLSKISPGSCPTTDPSPKK